MGYHLTLSRGPKSYSFWSHHEKTSPLKIGESYMIAYDPALGDPLPPEEMIYKGMLKGECVFETRLGFSWPMDVFYWAKSTK